MISGNFELIAPLVLFGLVMALGMPVAFSMAISGIAGLLLTLGPDATMGMLEIAPFGTAASYTLTTIAMFVLMAEFATQSGITQRLFDAANRMVGHMKGGLAVATIYAAAAFGAISGSSVASAATMAGIAVPEMRARGYDGKLSVGVVAIAGTLAVMIPPSLAMIVYGIITETSIGRLLLAGIIPGLLTAFAHMLTVRGWLYVSPHLAPPRREPDSWADRWHAIRGGWPFVLVILTVFGGLYSGIITATEAGAAGAAATLVVWFVGRWVMREYFAPVTTRAFVTALDRTLRTTAMIVTLLIGAYLFNYFLTATGVTQGFVAYVTDLPFNRYVLLALLVAMYVFLGMFLSQLEIMVLTLPLVFPLIVSLGFDPVWFGVIIIKTVEIGLVTPPVGMNVYVAAGATPDVTSAEGFRGVVPFIVMDVFIIVLLVAFPELALFIPNSADIG